MCWIFGMVMEALSTAGSAHSLRQAPSHSSASQRQGTRRGHRFDPEFEAVGIWICAPGPGENSRAQAEVGQGEITESAGATEAVAAHITGRQHKKTLPMAVASNDAEKITRAKDWGLGNVWVSAEQTGAGEAAPEVDINWRYSYAREGIGAGIDLGVS